MNIKQVIKFNNIYSVREFMHVMAEKQIYTKHP